MDDESLKEYLAEYCSLYKKTLCSPGINHRELVELKAKAGVIDDMTAGGDWGFLTPREFLNFRVTELIQEEQNLTDCIDRVARNCIKQESSDGH
jgi:hypothetical protein